MVGRRSRKGGLILAAASALLGPTVVVPAQTDRAPRPKVVELDPAAEAYTRILGGPPETVTMRSGCVVLEPSKSVGRHNTEDYEEAVIVLSGAGEVRLADGAVLALRPNVVAYCPPGTEHDVVNTGTAPLRYIYLVAKAR